MASFRNAFIVAAAVLLAACASAPASIGDAPPGDPTLPAVRTAPERYRAQTVRWGGVIASVRNLKDESELEVVGRRLDRNARPLAEDHSDGRFLARVTQFIDPAIYAVGREVTLRGELEESVARTIGEFPYTYPVVRVEAIYLWAQRPATARYPDYDPFWHDPFYPWGYPYWPYYRPRYPY